MAEARKPREFDKDISKGSRRKSKRFDPSCYILKRRCPFFPRSKEENDIYVTNKTNQKALLKKCDKLFDKGRSEIIIHGLGAAVYRACTLALQLKEEHCGGIDLEIKTSTVPIIDDFEPLTDDGDYELNKRQNSAVHIRAFRTFTLSGLKYHD